MNNENHENSIQENVLKAIEAGKIKMLPKWHFVLRAALVIVGIVLISLVLLYLVSFIIFILRQTGTLFIPGSGLYGINLFLESTPWLLVGIAVVFIVLLQILIKKYAFGYGKPLMYSAIGIIIFVIFGGALVEMSPLHRNLFRQAEDRGLPFAGAIYKQYGTRRIGNITIGPIVEVIDTGYKIESRENENVNVIVTPQTRMPIGITFKLGDIIVVFGHRKDNMVSADGIRIFDGLMPPLRNPPLQED